MKEAALISSSDYLEKLYKKEAEVPVEEMNKVIERLSVPIERVVYGEGDGVNLQSGECKLQFDYSSLGEESTDVVGQFLDWAVKSDKIPEDKFSDSKNWKEMNRLEMTFENDPEKVFSIQEILSSGSKIFFYPNSEMINGWAHQEQGNVYVIGDPSKPITLVTLLHEVGHLLDFKKLEKLGVKRLTASDDIHADEAEDLRKERAASAFALKLLRAYLKKTNISIKDTLLFLKHYALKSHQDSIKHKIVADDSANMHFGRDMMHEMEQWDQEEMDRKMFDEYWKWKKTDSYAEWRKLDKYKDIDEFDEFAAWREWCEENSKDWWNNKNPEQTS